MKLHLIIFFLLWQAGASAQNMDEKIKALANEIADQVVKNGSKKVAVTTLDYKGCTTEFGKFLAEELTGNLSVSGRAVTVVNQKVLESLLAQNRLTAKGLLEAKNDAAKLGQVSGIDALVYGTITTLGEDIRVSVNVVRLPTLTVFGYAKSSFSLTSGIKSMLPCLTESLQQNSQEPSDETTLTQSPTPSSDCKAKNTCVICVTNKSAVNVKARLYGWQPVYYVHPNETICWEDVLIGRNASFADTHVDFVNDSNMILKRDKFVAEPCKVYKRSFIK